LMAASQVGSCAYPHDADAPLAEQSSSRSPPFVEHPPGGERTAAAPTPRDVAAMADEVECGASGTEQHEFVADMALLVEKVDELNALAGASVHPSHLTSPTVASPSFGFRAGGEQQSVATPRSLGGWDSLPCRHFKDQSCFCLGSAFEVESIDRLTEPELTRVWSGAGDGKGEIVREASGESRLKMPDSLLLVMFRDGFQLRGGPLRSYQQSSNRSFVKDILDGYFPFELKQQFPEGGASHPRGLRPGL
jgi:hypothetical protein